MLKAKGLLSWTMSPVQSSKDVYVLEAQVGLSVLFCFVRMRAR